MRLIFVKFYESLLIKDLPLFIYPIEESYKLLAATGISGIWAPIMLYSASVLDGMLGIATWVGYKPSTSSVQLCYLARA